MPPDIIDQESSGDLTVREGQDVTLTCRAKGHPAPSITWRREDNQDIILDSTQTGKFRNSLAVSLPLLELHQERDIVTPPDLNLRSTPFYDYFSSYLKPSNVFPLYSFFRMVSFALRKRETKTKGKRSVRL